MFTTIISGINILVPSLSTISRWRMHVPPKHRYPVYRTTRRYGSKVTSLLCETLDSTTLTHRNQEGRQKQLKSE
jgi:hypothetical protein